MPAIHLPRLQQQVSELVEHYADTELFLRRLQDLFEFYGDRTRRPTQKTHKTTGLTTSNVPQPVLRQIILQLTPYAENAPHAMLALARSLWEQPKLEHRQLAAQLLGKIPLDYAKELFELLPIWVQENHEEDILQSFASVSLSIVQKQDPGLLVEKVESWLYPQKPAKGEEDAQPPLSPAKQFNLQKLAASALIPLINNPQYENLPKIFNLITPLLSESPKNLRPYLLDILRPLARRSPPEVAYLLRQQITENPSQAITWLARRTLSALPEDVQANLQPLLAKTKPQ